MAEPMWIVSAPRPKISIHTARRGPVLSPAFGFEYFGQRFGFETDESRKRRRADVESLEVVEKTHDVRRRKRSATLEVFVREALHGTSRPCHSRSNALMSSRSWGRPLTRFIAIRSGIDRTSTGAAGRSKRLVRLPVRS